LILPPTVGDGNSGIRRDPHWQAVGLGQLSGTELELSPTFRSFEANIGNI
jgi:hypothetical protein